MTLDVNVLLMDMPATIPAYSILNQDISYTIVINSRLNKERQRDAYQHEMDHIKRGDYDRRTDADIIECYAHALSEPRTNQAAT